MSYFSNAVLTQVRSDPSSIVGLYSADQAQFISDLGMSGLSDAAYKAAFCTILAYDLAAYGPEPGTNDLQQLLAAPTLACDRYVTLAWELMDLLGVPGDDGSAIGWDGGAVGNHAQLLFDDGQSQLLLDPTIGLVVDGVTLNGLINGVRYSDLASFYSRNDITSFNSEVINAVETGAYKVSDVIYDVPGLHAWTTDPLDYLGLTIDHGNGSQTIVGSIYGDFISTATGNDTVFGGFGDDTLVGGSGNNFIFGGEGNDWLYGGAGNDFIEDENGNNVLYGGTGNSLMQAGNGNDIFYGGSGNSTMYGGTGNDIYIGGSGRSYEVGNGTATSVDYFYLSTAAGSEAFGGPAGEDVFIAGPNGSVMIGEGANNFMYGAAGGNNYYYGGSGDSEFFGGSGVDVMIGGSGDDYFDGGTGVNYYFGGAGGSPGTGIGVDTFNVSSGGIDVVQDWTQGKDTVLLNGSGFQSFSDVLSHSYQNGAYFIVQVDAQTAVWLNGATSSSVTANDFGW